MSGGAPGRRAGAGRWTPAGVALAVVLLVAGCGIPEDSAPRALGPVLATPTPTVTPEPAQTQLFTIYLVAPNELLAPAPREVPAPPDLDVQALLDQLTVPPTDEERARGLATSIPANATFFSDPVVRDNGVAVLDFETGSFDAIGGSQLQEALAQLVYTFTESGSIDSLVVLIDGERVPWPTSGGESTEPLVRADYATFDPAFVPEPTPSPMPAPDTATAG